MGRSLYALTQCNKTLRTEILVRSIFVWLQQFLAKSSSLNDTFYFVMRWYYQLAKPNLRDFGVSIENEYLLNKTFPIYIFATTGIGKSAQKHTDHVLHFHICTKGQNSQQIYISYYFSCNGVYTRLYQNNFILFDIILSIFIHIYRGW